MKKVNIDWRDGIALLGKKPLPEQMLIQVYVAIRRAPQGHNDITMTS